MLASPDADDASPEAVGKELLDSILKWHCSYSSSMFECDLAPRDLAYSRIRTSLFDMG